MQDATGRYEWAHDAAGRLTRYTQLDDEHSYYEYDAGGRRTSYTDPNGDDTTYDYDARGALTRLNEFDGHDTYFRYDAAGRRTVKQLQNGMLTYHGYDAASQAAWTVNRKSDLAHLSSVYYEYNGDSLPTWQYRRGEFSVDHQYVYDDVPRLAVERVYPPGDHVDPIYSFGYYYDGNSRRYALIREDMGLTYYDYDASDALQTIQYPDDNWAYYSYDADGNTTQIESTGGDAGTQGTTYYEWDSENLMTSARVPGVETENEFTWNADSQRASRVDSSGTLSFLRDGQKLVAEKTDGGVLAARYVNEGDSLYSWLVSDKRDTTRRYPTFDLLGTVHNFVGSGQTVLGSNLFEAYGTRPASATGTVTGPYGYVGALGYHWDPDPALHLLSIRHYRTSSGLFVARDRAQGKAAYVYTGGLPIGAVDPEGLFSVDTGACGALADDIRKAMDDYVHGNAIANGCIGGDLMECYKDAFRYGTITCGQQGKGFCGLHSCGTIDPKTNKVIICLDRNGRYPPDCPTLGCLLIHELVHVAYDCAGRRRGGGGSFDSPDSERHAEQCEHKCCAPGDATAPGPEDPYNICPRCCGWVNPWSPTGKWCACQCQADAPGFPNLKPM